MKHIYWCIVILFVSVNVDAQTYNNKSLLARRAVYAEFFGASLGMGINYDSRFAEDSRWGYRVGLAYGEGVNMPLEINYLVGRRETKNKLDLGLGVNLPCYKDGELGAFAFLNIGYRLQPMNGLIFRVGLSPKFPLDDKFESWGSAYIFWAASVIPYLSLGYAF